MAFTHTFTGVVLCHILIGPTRGNVRWDLTFLVQRLHQFNTVLAAFPDDIVREEQRLRLFPSPFSMLLIGRPDRWRLRMLLGLMVVITVVLLPLILLLWAQVGFPVVTEIMVKIT